MRDGQSRMRWRENEQREANLYKVGLVLLISRGNQPMDLSSEADLSVEVSRGREGKGVCEGARWTHLFVVFVGHVPLA